MHTPYTRWEKALILVNLALFLYIAYQTISAVASLQQ